MNWLRKLFRQKPRVSAERTATWLDNSAYLCRNGWASLDCCHGPFIGKITEVRPASVIVSGFGEIPTGNGLLPEWCIDDPNRQKCEKCHYPIYDYRVTPIKDGRQVIARITPRFCPHCGFDMLRKEAREAMKQYMIDVANGRKPPRPSTEHRA